MLQCEISSASKVPPLRHAGGAALQVKRVHQQPGVKQVKGPTSAAKVVVVAHDGAGIPVKAAAVLIPQAGRVLV